MQSRTITLQEYATNRVALSTAQAAWLREYVPGLDVKQSWGLPGSFDLTPGSHVGTVSLPGLTVQIRPKLPVQRVMFLVAYALDSMNWKAAVASLAQSPDLLESMAHLYAKALGTALKRGLLQGYRTKDDTLLSVRGRIRFADQLRVHYGKHMPLEVTYDDFTVDTELNRLLYAALIRLRGLPLRFGSSRTLLASCLTAFSEGVSYVSYEKNRFPEISWTRLNQHFRTAAELARSILEATSAELEFGGLRGTTFTIDMNRVFELFVRTALRDALELPRSAWPDGSSGLTLDAAGLIQLRPDLTWRHNGRALFVGDVKYKRTGSAGAPNADLYQLLAYTTALDLRAGLLVYAEGGKSEISHEVRHLNTSLVVRTLDVDGTPTEVLESVERLALRIRELAAVAPRESMHAPGSLRLVATP